MTKPKVNYVCSHCRGEFKARYTQPYCSLDCALWSRVDKRGPSDCWNWTGSKHVYGYGEFRYKRALYRSHRAALELSGVEIPDGLHALHSCDNPSCCNPDHLRVGTQEDNMADVSKRGRSGRRKLTDAQAREIRRLHASGESQAELSRMFSVSQPTIWHIVKGKIYKHA